MNNIEDVYRQIIEIAKKNKIEKIVLFGSRARGDNQPKSDIDLAVYGCKDYQKFVEELNEELWSLLQLDIINMDDTLWLEMLQERNNTSHMYNEAAAKELVDHILNRYIAEFDRMKNAIIKQYGNVGITSQQKEYSHGTIHI